MALRKVLIGDVCRIYSGGDAPKIISDKKTADCPIPVYSNGLQDEGLYGYTNEAQIEGDVVSLTARGANSGVVFYRKEPFLPIVRLISIIPDRTRINSRYLYYLLKTKVFLASKTGAAQPQITIPAVAREEISYEIDIRTQIRIADILSAYDNLIENNQKQIKLLEEAAQRLYKEWFIDLRFPGHETTKIQNDLPEGWQIQKLAEIADVVMGQSPKSEFYNSERKGLPFHQGVGCYGNRFVKDDVYSSVVTRIAEAGSILFSVRAPVGRLNVTKNRIVIGRGLAALNHKENCQSFLFYMLKERFFKEDILGNGAIFASITKDELLSQKFIIPQRVIMQKFEKIVSAMDTKIIALDSKIQNLKEARDRLLPKLMSGEIEVR